MMSSTSNSSNSKSQASPQASLSRTYRTIDPAILSLFCSELQMQMAVLTANLLRLEAEGSDREVLAALMRAAHSLKGAARMVHLDVIVILAHELENYFVQLQSGKWIATSNRPF